jgi:aspartate-semialdehyde dehydrogenase
VSGAGKEGMDELFEQSRAIFVGDQAEPKSSPSRSRST